ncbi:MAG: bifunctional oligoribonuclease/PAP phosphatase NrnA [Fuerstiella sp.]|nr:bifunctional oligoribonuclease/PAP phosphatase NrnA [Fuerstiella sp.]
MSRINWAPLKNIIERHESFLITTHVRPDADALGSQRGLASLLESFGKEVTMVNATAPPANLNFMNTDGEVKKLGNDVRKDEVPDVDVQIVVDTSAWQQLGAIRDVIRNSDCPRVVIDHHVSSDDLGATEFKDVASAATGELICEAAEYLGVTFDADAASWLYAAIATDTGWFRFPSTTSQTMRTCATLMEQGARPDVIYNHIHEQRSLARVHLSSRVLGRMQVECGGQLAWISVTRNDLEATQAVLADTEGLVNECLTVAGSKAAFIAVELPTSQVKCSLRCRPPYNVSAFAERLGGGGHRLASGVTLSGEFSDAVERIRKEFQQILESDN